jgi:hypothetical protein
MFHSLAKIVLHNMTAEIVNWINSGFQGSPAFVTDLGQFLLDSADQAAGQFIYDDPDLSFLCSPFQLDVKIALAVSYQESTYDSFASCTLSDVTDNIEGFLSGSFSEGGWQSWFEVTQNPINTPTGAYLEAEGEMYARIVDAQGNTIKELDWGGGFLSFKVCDETAAATGAQQNCTITTPGQTIADQINTTLGAGQDELIAADEINEIIAALFAQLAKQAITGVNGLLGVSSGTGYTDYSFDNPSGTTTQSYLDAAEDDAVLNMVNPFLDSIRIENEYLALQQQIIADIDEVEDRLDEAYSADEACFNVVMSEDLITARDDARREVTATQANIAELQVYSTTFENTTNATDLIGLADTYSDIIASGDLHTDVDVAATESLISSMLEMAIADMNTQIDDEIDSCNIVL